MMSGIPHPDLALYRLVKGGEGGLGLRIEDLYDRRVEFKFLGLTIKGVLKAYPKRLIDKLIMIQRAVDDKILEEVEKAKHG